MKKLLVFLLALFIATPLGYSIDEWDKTDPAGTESPSDIDSLVTANLSAVDRLITNYREGASVISSTAADVKVLAGEISCTNSAGTVLRFRRNTATATVGWSDIDTGAESSGAVTQYYVYADCDADATTFTGAISLSASAPSGVTYYRKLGYFTNNASNNIVSVGNVESGSASNFLSVSVADDITTTSTTYSDMTDMVLYFVGSGRPVRLNFTGAFENTSSQEPGYLVFDIDGTDYGIAAMDTDSAEFLQQSFTTSQILTSGAHTLKVQWKTDAGSFIQKGATAPRVFTAEEL